MKQFIIAMLAIVVQLGQPGLCGYDAAAQGLDTSINGVLTKPNLKILHIGNSFTFDTTCYLPEIVKGMEADVSDLCIYRMMLSSASFKDWYDTYNDIDIHLDYRIEKVVGGIDAGIATGEGKAGDGSLFRQALSGEQWNIIFIQPDPFSAPYYEQWTNHDANGYLNELLAIIREHQPQATIGLVLQHSSASNDVYNAEGSSLERWRLIAESVRQCYGDYDIGIVLPYGTAVQNLRASSLNNDMDLTSDGAHCEFVLTRYAASCCYYQAIIAPRTGIPVTEDKTRINKEWIQGSSPMISVDDYTASIAQKAAMLAVADMYHCNNPETSVVVGMNKVQSSPVLPGIYDLQGRRLADKPQKGMFIQDRKKYVK